MIQKDQKTWNQSKSLRSSTRWAQQTILCFVSDRERERVLFQLFLEHSKMIIGQKVSVSRKLITKWKRQRLEICKWRERERERNAIQGTQKEMSREWENKHAKACESSYSLETRLKRQPRVEIATQSPIHTVQVIPKCSDIFFSKKWLLPRFIHSFSLQWSLLLNIFELCMFIRNILSFKFENFSKFSSHLGVQINVLRFDTLIGSKDIIIMHKFSPPNWIASFYQKFVDDKEIVLHWRSATFRNVFQQQKVFFFHFLNHWIVIINVMSRSRRYLYLLSIFWIISYLISWIQISAPRISSSMHIRIGITLSIAARSIQVVNPLQTITAAVARICTPRSLNPPPLRRPVWPRVMLSSSPYGSFTVKNPTARIPIWKKTFQNF